ncbi:MAG: hypothetical protein LUD16_00470 [Lachnospiraceae bacterium]|nr:hypothetical protein [Lachnospiraceae bacterium]
MPSLIIRLVPSERVTHIFYPIYDIFARVADAIHNIVARITQVVGNGSIVIRRIVFIRSVRSIVPCISISSIGACIVSGRVIYEAILIGCIICRTIIDFFICIGSISGILVFYVLGFCVLLSRCIVGSVIRAASGQQCHTAHTGNA